MSDAQVLAEVTDRLDIAEVLSRYAQGWDTRDFDRVVACFTPGPAIGFAEPVTSSGGQTPLHAPVQEILPFASAT